LKSSEKRQFFRQALQTLKSLSDTILVMRKAAFFILIGIVGALSVMSFAEQPVTAATTTEELFPADLLAMSSTQAFAKHVLLVDKSERKLLVYERDGETVRKIDEIPADIGKNNGNKEKENDFRTPEGLYFFQQRKSPPEIPFSLYGKMAFTTDYPNLFDKRLKKTGYGIWLHSIPETVALTRGSRGCVVIRNEALEKIQGYIELKQTPIIIYDKIQYVTKAEHDRRRVELSQWMESWRAAWQSQDADKFLSFYDSNFSAPGFSSFKSWKKHKSRLAKKYQAIKVTLNQPFFLLHKDQLIVKTLQKYESDQHTDYGVKTIHALKTSDGYRIVHEEWAKANEGGETALSSVVQSASDHLTD
jgi:murein L,D-transpeptidase YafK